MYQFANQDFYLEEQQKKIEERLMRAIEIARTSGIPLINYSIYDTIVFEEDDNEQ